jgi:hypothetical protein
MSNLMLEIGLRVWRVRPPTAVIVIACATTAILVGAWALLDGVAASRLKNAIAEADRTDPRWRQADVWASRAPVPDAENSALRVQMVVDRLPPHWLATKAGSETNALRRLTELSSRLSQLEPRRRLSDEDGRRLHEDLGGVTPARLLALELARLPNGRFAVPSQYLFLHEPTEHSEKVRRVVRLLQLEAVDRIQRSDIDGALEACCGIFNAGRLFQSRLRRPRFTLAEVGGLVAATAVAFKWPILLVPTLSVALTLYFTRLGFSLILAIILVSLALFVLGLTLPPIVAH